jgi:heptosyltransferase III
VENPGDVDRAAPLAPAQARAPAAVRPVPRRILALCTRRLGDVLLTTALLRSLRRAWPQAELDVLTLRWSAPALDGNPDVSRVIAIPEAAPVALTLRALGAPRRYDLAVGTLYSDRTHYTALWAAGTRVNLVPPTGTEGSWWKRRLSTRFVPRDQGCHMVEQYLRLADALGIPRQRDLVPPRAPAPNPALASLGRPYAVVHPAPMYRYKRWTVAGWRELVRWLARQGLQVVLSGGPAAEERAYVAEVAAEPGSGVVNLAGTLTFPELAGLIAPAAVFVGPDTSVTHLAAATGAPTVAIYGPTAVTTWGPWPAGAAEVEATPWQNAAPVQHAGNVWLMQGIEHCVPCWREGCERHRDSRADCLDFLPAARVIAVTQQALSAGAPKRQV